MIFSYLYWDPKAELFNIPWINVPVFWYGIFFAAGFWLGFLVFVRILLSYFRHLPSYRQLKDAELKAKVQKIADRLTVYIVIATLVGARLGHFFFYEDPSEYFADPLEIFRIRNGGLASHGAVIGILLATLLFRYRIRKEFPQLTWVRILDFLAAPAALAGSFIRIGNFFNQEILGTFSDMPWAVVFGHPADHSFPSPRHPVQLYEAIGYFAIFCLLWHLSRKASILASQGKLIGLSLILIFSFRFAMEFFKIEQSHLLMSSYLTMGQLLSLPVILLGFGFYFWRPNRSHSTF